MLSIASPKQRHQKQLRSDQRYNAYLLRRHQLHSFRLTAANSALHRTGLYLLYNLWLAMRPNSVATGPCSATELRAHRWSSALQWPAPLASTFGRAPFARHPCHAPFANFCQVRAPFAGHRLPVTDICHIRLHMVLSGHRLLHHCIPQLPLRRAPCSTSSALITEPRAHRILPSRHLI